MANLLNREFCDRNWIAKLVSQGDVTQGTSPLEGLRVNRRFGPGIRDQSAILQGRRADYNSMSRYA